MKKPVDENLRRFATEVQWSRYLAFCEAGSWRKGAKLAGCKSLGNFQESVKAMLRRAAQCGYAPPVYNNPVPDGLTLRGVSQLLDAGGNLQKEWVKSRLEGRDPAEAVQLPDPKTLVKVSTMTDAQGRVIAQWTQEKPEEKAREAAWKEAAAALAEDLPRLSRLRAPKRASKDLLACYPVGDHHLGMLAWGEETGADYDLKIGEELLCEAIERLVVTVPSCERAVIAFLGDLLHYDSYETVTPTHRNMLDSDTRYPKMVRVTLRAVRKTIDTALLHHKEVLVIIEPGNHDLATSIFLMQAISAIYEKEPRVRVDTSPRHFHYFEHGACMVMTHHGHGAKPEKLPLIMATDHPELWGRTRYRYIWTGHIHHDSQKDFEGCRWESFRVLPPPDAWAANKGYRPMRDMKAIVLDREHGEVERHIVNPGMFRKG
jgi:hypothetical protein